MPFIGLVYILCALSAACTRAATTAQPFPNVDLGYAVHAPTFINTTASGLRVASYKNIRYAQPPTQERRFLYAQTPPPHETGILDGSEYQSTDCVSSAPSTVPYPGINGTNWGQEDCLFLNVQVPYGVKEGDNLPVIHWLHGSAYAFGSKDNPYTSVDPIGLYTRLNQTEEKFIFVASNYRLGLYGWMSSPYEDMDANIGVRDSELALEWTKQYIQKFGGDPDQITVIGQSAGAGIINLLLTARGGNGTQLPFSKAIISSSAIMPRRNVTSRRQLVYQQVLTAANCTSLECLRGVSFDTLSKANNYLITDGPTGTGGTAFGPSIGFSPFPDGSYILDEPMVLLQQGRFQHDVKQLITANMQNDGMDMVGDDNMPAAFGDLVRTVFTTADNQTVARIQSLFPFPADLPEKLAWDWLTSVAFACHSQSIAQAYQEKARRYVMTIPPATHGQDLYYIFFVDNATTPVNHVDMAHQIQDSILQFVYNDEAADREQCGPQEWPVYGSDANTMTFSETGWDVVTDPWVASGICKTLLQIIVDPQNGA